MSARRLARAGGLFLLLLTLAAWPSTRLRAAASAIISGAVQPVLGQLTFGRGGQAVLRAAPVVEVRRPGDNISSDAVLLLGAQGASDAEKLEIELSLRRDFYLPLVLFTAAVAAAPIAARARLTAFVLGFPLAWLSCCGFLYATICWLFALSAPAIYPLSAEGLKALDALASTFLLPPALRMFVSLAIAAAAVWWLRDAARSPFDASGRAAPTSAADTSASPNRS